MQIELFGYRHLDKFLKMSDAEQWICERWEFDFLFRAFPHGCFVATENRLPVGFVTSIKYGASGWIGNLIVRKESRGKGIGRLLMKKALAVLMDAGTESVWLTASHSGRPLYESLGFATIDVINRWVGHGHAGETRARDGLTRTGMLSIDQAGWGDRREALMDAIAVRGRVIAVSGAFLVIQPSVQGLQLGPWGGVGSQALLLLHDALAEAGESGKIFLDAPGGNAAVTSLLPESGLSTCGSTLLMCRGKAGNYVPEKVFALASMGSMG